ncbi:MAG: response regulator [Candidatus Promineifilaceae bacterium]
MTPSLQSSVPPRILIVDDSTDNRLLLASQLKMHGYEILQAEDGLEGIETTKREMPDLILLDVMMPKMSGFEVCSYLKSQPDTTHIPVIMVTALRDVQYRIQGIEAGADEFLSRPHHREELLVRVRSLVQLKRARDRLEEERNHIQLLYNVSRATTTQFNLTQMMVEIITHTCGAVEGTKGTILLLDEAGEVTHKVILREGQAAEVKSTVSDIVLTRGLVGWLIRNDQGSLIADVKQDKRWVTLPNDEPTGSVIGVPLSRANRIVGVMLLTHPQPGYFKAEHLALVETIGAQATAAIENAYLFAEINEQRRKLQTILAQSTDAIITTDELLRISLLNHAAERFFQLNADQVVNISLREIPQLTDLLPLFVKAGNKPVTQEITLQESKHLYVSVTPIQDVGYVAVMQDITELKRIEEYRLDQERHEKQLVKETFSRYMGPRLVEHVLSTEPGLFARRERRRAVVMFADLRDSTPLIIHTEANAAIKMLNEFFTQMTEIVYQFDGTIFDLVGDEMLVGFNVPFDQPDAPRRALMAAVAMHRRFDDLRQKWFRESGVELGLGLGIDQGEVVVGNVGAETRMNFAMVGEAVNTGHRLVEIAEDGQLIITESIYLALQQNQSLLMRELKFESMGLVSLKGKAKPQLLYRAQMERTLLPG